MSLKGLCTDQGFEIHGSTGAPLPEKNYGWQKKWKNIWKKDILRKRKDGTQNADFVP